MMTRGRVAALCATFLAFGASARARPDWKTELETSISELSQARFAEREEVSRELDQLRENTIRMTGGDDPAVPGKYENPLPSASPHLCEEQRTNPFETTRVQRLRSVLRLIGGAQHTACTGTLVSVGQEPWILTAAHCLYGRTADGGVAAGPPSLTLAAEFMTFPLETREGLVDEQFGACARWIRMSGQVGVRIEYCLGVAGVRDIALIPVPIGARVALHSYDQWTIAASPAADSGGMEFVRAYGMGMVANQLNKCLLSGSFEICPRNAGAPWIAAAIARVDPGDSGGPVLMRATDDKLETAIPEVAFVISQRRPTAMQATSTCPTNALAGYDLVMQPVGGLSMDGLVPRGAY